MGGFSTVVGGASAKEVWEYPPFRALMFLDNTATSETNSIVYTTLRSFTAPLPRPMKVFKVRIKALRRNRNTGTTSIYAYFRAVVNGAVVSLGGVLADAGTTVDSWIDTTVVMDFTTDQTSLTIDLQAAAASSVVYASYRPYQLIELGFLFSPRQKVVDGVIIPHELVEEELESKINRVLEIVSKIRYKMGIV
ncbi:MAG: hypothetical protein QW820_07065 [Sulfolobales archaeon]